MADRGDDIVRELRRIQDMLQQLIHEVQRLRRAKE